MRKLSLLLFTLVAFQCFAQQLEDCNLRVGKNDKRTFSFEYSSIFTEPTNAQYQKIYDVFEGEKDTIWESANAGFAITNKKAKSDTYPTTHIDNGYSGKCVRLRTSLVGALGKMVNMPMAAGNFFIGSFDKSNAMKSALTSTKFGIITRRNPVSLDFWYKYKRGDKFTNEKLEEMSELDYPDAYAVLYRPYDVNGERDSSITEPVLLDGTSVLPEKSGARGNIVAYAKWDNKNIINENNLDSADFHHVSIPFKFVAPYSEINYKELKEGQYYLTIVFTSSYKGDYFYGAEGSTLYIDEVTISFESDKYIHIDAHGEESNMGKVTGGGTYEKNKYATLVAIPENGYRFVQWKDGNNDNPRQVYITQDSTFEAIFKSENCTITVLPNFNIMGQVEGGGVYKYSSIASFVAVPANGCYFEKWSDGSTENPHYVKVTGDQNYVAIFAVGTATEEKKGEVISNDGVDVTPYETKAAFTWPSIMGVASYSLVIWADVAQTQKVCTLTFNAVGQLTNIDFTQSVKEQSYTQEVVGGLNFTVTGLKQGTTYGYTLDAKDAEEEIISHKTGTFTTQGTDGIAEITAVGINVYAEGKTIVMEGANDEITITDALGRVIANNHSPLQKQTFAVPNAGVYIVKIGNNAVSVLVK